MKNTFRLFGLVVGFFASIFLFVAVVLAADGSGTNTVSPTTASASSTGNTFTFTFTAAETMDSGSIVLTIPSGWSAPQGTSGVAGYTTVSSTGTTAFLLDGANSTTNWSAGSACSGGFSLDTTNKHEGSGSIKCINSNDKVHDVWYKNITSQNWSGYTTVGFWIYSNSPINNGDLKFEYDDSANLASPIESLSLGRNVASNTWTYVPFNFAALASTRTAIVSFGLEIANASSMKNATVTVDDFLLGPASGPVFSGNTITIQSLTLASGQTVTITYGDGGGTSGATAPASPGIYTFTTQTRATDSGTLTSITSQPAVTINNPIPTTTSISPDTKTAGQAQFTLTVNGTNFISSSTVQVDGVSRTTSFVSSSQLTATIPSTDIAAAATHSITVLNGTPGGGTSNAQTLTVVNAPSVTSVTSLTSDGSYKAGQVIPIQVTFSRAVTVSGTPQLTLSTGSPSTTELNYTSGSGGTTLTFNYTVASGNTSSDLDYASTSALALNSGTIIDSVTGANATLTLVSPGAANSLGANKAIVIDTTAPTVTGVTSSTANGSYKAGQAISIQVNFSEAVTVTGTPQLTLVTGTPATTAVNYASGSGTSSLTFTYTVAAGNTSSDLDYASTTALALNSGTIKDAAGNNATLTLASPGAANSLGANKAIVVDTTAPTLAEVTAVTTPTNDTTPDYTFSSSEVGTITYGGDCVSVTTSSTSGNNTITFNTLTTGTHANCTITVTDAAGNASAPLSVTTFVIDTTAPTLAEVTAVTTPTNDTTPNYTFSTTEAGTITYGGDCSSSATSTAAGNKTITFNALSEGTHSNCIVTVTDAVGNASAPLSVTAFVIDTTAPVVTEVTPIASPTADVTPNYTFSSTEAGSLTYGGDCSSATTSAASGNTTVTFATLSEGSHTNCTIVVTDTAGNASSTLNVTSFIVQLPSPAVKFVILDPSDATVGGNVIVTIQAQNASNSVVTSYQNDVTIMVSGSATVIGGSDLVAINDGVGTITITDTVAQDVTVSLIDTEGTGLTIDSTQSVTFAAGALHHFSIDNIPTQTVDQSFVLTATAEDQYGNIVTGFTGNVDLSTTAGTISPTSSGSFIGGVKAENVTITQSGTGKTITVTRVGGSEAGISNGFTVNAGPTSAYFLSNPGSMTAGTRLAYVVTRKDTHSNLATTGAEIVRLYTTSGATAQFYDAAIGGNVVTSITIASGQSQAAFWYADDNVGSWTITASDAIGAPDGAAGIADATDGVDVLAEPIIATKFVIEVAANATVGATVQVTVKAENASDQLDTTYNRLNNSIFLHSTGSATANSGIAFTIVNGIGTVNVTDTVAESITLTLQDLIPDSPALDASANAAISFAPGALHHFSVATPSTQVAGVPFTLVVTAQDQYGNTVTSFAAAVDLSTTAGTISPAASGLFVNGVLNEQVSVTLAASNKTIAVVRSGGTEAGVSGNFSINPGPTAVYELNNPGSMTVGTRIGYVVTRKDASGNLATMSDESVYLYTNSASPAGFFGAATGGSNITQITIGSGQSNANFWYSDTHEGTWIVTVSDNGSSADGVTGIDDATDSVTVDAAPIVATKFLVFAQTTAPAGGNIIITVKAVDDAGAVDTTYQNDVTLTVSGSAAIFGGNSLVDIVNGVGYITITDATAETIIAGLDDTQGTGLNSTHTRTIEFQSGGGVSVPPENVNIFVTESAQPSGIAVTFSGKAFPKGLANAFIIGKGNIPIKQNTTSADGRFSIGFSTELDGNRFYGLFVTDTKGRVTQAKIFAAAVAEEILKVSDILFSPTIEIERDSISRGDFVVITGSSTPGSTVELEIDGKLVGIKTIANAAGAYRMLYNTGAYDYGAHSARVRQITTKRETSDFSVLKSYSLVDYRIQPGDINRDGDVDVRDGSIFLALWNAKDPVARKRIDLNGDGKIDVKDFSIFIRTIQGRK